MFLELASESKDQLARLRGLLGKASTIVNTPLADALAAMLEYDRRHHYQDEGISRSAALTDEELVQLAIDLNRAFETKAEFRLPFGGEAESKILGSVEVDGLCLVLDAGRPGLFPLETTSRVAQGPNLELLCFEIERLTRNLACRRLGVPVAVELVDTGVRHLLQFLPLDEAGGVVLQRSAGETGAARFCAASPRQIKEFAKDIVLDMRALWSQRSAIALRVRDVRRAAEHVCANAPQEVKVHSLDIEMRFQRSSTSFDLSVEYEALDEAMRPGIVLDFVPGDLDVDAGAYRMPPGVCERWDDLDELQKSGAHGMIDEMALCVLGGAPEGQSAVLARLAVSYETTVVIPAGTSLLFATLYWQGACIQAELFAPQELQYISWQLDIFDAIVPETSLTALVSRQVSSIVEMPFKCSCIVEEIRNVPSKGFRIYTNCERFLVNLSSGRAWVDSAGSSRAVVTH